MGLMLILILLIWSISYTGSYIKKNNRNGSEECIYINIDI